MADDTVILYHMILGSQDTANGQFQRGYTILTAHMIIFPPGVRETVTGHGLYSGRNSMGITKTEVYEGDIIKEPSTSICYLVTGLRPHAWLSEVKFTAVDLKEIDAIDVRIPTSGASPISDPKFFGFESITPGSVEFEDGFERGYFV